MSNEVDLIDKLATAYQTLAKTVSEFGAAISKNNDEIIDLKRLVKDFTTYSKEMLDSHDNSIKSLDEAKTTIFSSVKMLWLIIPTVVVLSGIIINQWTNNYDERLNKMEAESKEMAVERRETLDKVFQLLAEQKKLLNQGELKDIIANIYR